MRRLLPALLPLLGACSSTDSNDALAVGVYHPSSKTPSATPPLAGATPCDELIQKDEKHFAHLWKLSKDVEQAAEGYWSNDGKRLVYQGMPRGTSCDQIFVIEPDGTHKRLSDGNGVTTCAYFLPGDHELLYASTHAWMQDCPPRPDMSKGYVWAVRPEFDIYVHDLATGKERALTTEWGYDAEATVSPAGDRIAF